MTKSRSRRARKDSPYFYLKFRDYRILQEKDGQVRIIASVRGMELDAIRATRELRELNPDVYIWFQLASSPLPVSCKCDGDHPVPACPDPKCWRKGDSENV